METLGIYGYLARDHKEWFCHKIDWDGLFEGIECTWGGVDSLIDLHVFDYKEDKARLCFDVLLYMNSLSRFWLAESVQWIFEISACDVITADYTIIMSRTLKVTGNHVMYDRGAWFVRVIMSSSLALSCLPSVKEQKHDFFVSFNV